MPENKPLSEVGHRLATAMGAKRWAKAAVEARRRAAILDDVFARHAAGGSLHSAVKLAVDRTLWPTFCNWKRKHLHGEGVGWERLVDRRQPPSGRFSSGLREAAEQLRRTNASISCDAARVVLRALHGTAGDVSDTWLLRVWAGAGLSQPAGAAPGVAKARAATAVPVAAVSNARVMQVPADEEVEVLHGGAGLALLAAADTETLASAMLARCVVFAGDWLKLRDKSTDSVASVDDADRDDHGRFTAAYNARHRQNVADGVADARWSTDDKKAAARSLKTLDILDISEAAVQRKLLAMAVSSMLTEQRGFDGLSGPAGHWLAALGGVAYMPATLDKALTELGLLGIEGALWQTHAATWHLICKRWQVPTTGWQHTALYVDGTADPFWTQRYAKSGKVSRVGRVMPCLSKVAINGGAGVPLLIESHAGAVSMAKRLQPMLATLRQAVGPEACVHRLTVVDSECGTAPTMWAMSADPNTIFITVLKGAVLKGARFDSEGPWLRYRDRDEIREIMVEIGTADAAVDAKAAPEAASKSARKVTPKAAEKAAEKAAKAAAKKAAQLPVLRLRCVQMRRESHRHPHQTTFVTNDMKGLLATSEVANEYLRRWPCQEQTFRDGRDGIGLERSHGFGGGSVAHVAIVEKREIASKAKARAVEKLESARQMHAELAAVPAAAKAGPEKRALAEAKRKVTLAEKKDAQTEAAQQKLATTPDDIWARDTGRDSIMTCLKVMLIGLLEFTLREYFDNTTMNWRGFIETILPLAVTVRTSETRRLYQVEPNARQPERMAQLAAALRRINQRKLSRDGRLLVFEMLPLARSSGP